MPLLRFFLKPLWFLVQSYMADSRFDDDMRRPPETVQVKVIHAKQPLYFVGGYSITEPQFKLKLLIAKLLGKKHIPEFSGSDVLKNGEVQNYTISALEK